MWFIRLNTIIYIGDINICKIFCGRFKNVPDLIAYKLYFKKTIQNYKEFAGFNMSNESVILNDMDQISIAYVNCLS